MDLAHEGQTPNTLLTPVPDKSLADIEGIHEKKNIDPDPEIIIKAGFDLGPSFFFFNYKDLKRMENCQQII